MVYWEHFSRQVVRWQRWLHRVLLDVRIPDSQGLCLHLVLVSGRLSWPPAKFVVHPLVGLGQVCLVVVVRSLSSVKRVLDQQVPVVR